MTGTSTFRIPRAELTGPTGRVVRALSRRLWGEVADNAFVLFHHRRVMRGIFGFERSVRRWDSLDPHLKSYDHFLAAAAEGDLQSLADVLAPDMVLLTDGGGVKRAALRPIKGAEKVLRFLMGVYDAASEVEAIVVNGAPALRLGLDGTLEAVTTFAMEDGRVTHAYIVRNPHKLHAVHHPTILTR